MSGLAIGREFALGGVMLDLPEVTTNVDVYFSAMRFNRAANEWDVDATVSNKTSGVFSGPVVLLVDRFTGTSGALRPDGVSAGQAFFDLSPELADNALAEGGISQPRTLALGFTTNAAPQLITRVFALAAQNSAAALGFTRSLNQVGQPLPAVSILESGPTGTGTNATDPAFGVATLGQTAGTYVWKFSLDGYLPVWREATLQSNHVALIPYPWLTARNAQSFPVSPLTGGTASNQTVQVQFAPVSVSQGTVVQLTALDGQTLPALLPQGWSPLQAFWLELGREPTQPAAATLTPWGPLGTNDTVALVRLDPGSLAWQTLQLVTGHATNALSVVLPGSGAYALVVADATPVAPPAAVVGSALSASAALAPDPTNFLASGTVTPATSPASPMPELVTATADVAVTNITGPLASGTLLRGEVSQSYQLQDNSTRAPPQFDSFIVGYQRPGDPSNGTLHARFPLRPVLLFGPDRLNQADVRVALFAPSDFSGGVLDTNGGQIASAPVRLLAAPATLPRREAILLRNVNPTNFVGLTGTNQPVLAAFEAAFDGAATNQELSVQASGLPANSTFVLARVIDSTGLYGLEPRARVHSDANGNLLSDEPTNSDRLTGLTGSGQYVLAQVQPQQGLVEGVANDASGRPAGGLPVSVAGEPWLTFSAADGSFKLLAPVGTGTVSLLNPATGDTGAQPITVPAALTPVSTSVALGVSGLRVASITPADTATNVPQVTSVAITFNRPLNPATLVSNAVQLIEGSNQPVTATFSLDLANTTLTLLPNTQLDPATQFTVALSTNITDGLGRLLTGQTEFTFTTVALSARSAAAQLIIYEPGATNLDTNIVADLPGYTPATNNGLVVVHGTAGAADPGVPVIIVNEASGDTTTVLSKSDGSFTSFVPGQEQDFISATFVSLNNSHIYVPVNRQLFDDGSVGLFQQGGVLQATGDGGPVQVTVPPNALSGRTKFKVSSVTTNELATQLGGVMPNDGTVAGSALNLQIDGTPPTLPVQVSFPVDLAALGYPTNEAPTNVAAVATAVRNTQNVTTFEVLNQMSFQPKSGVLRRLGRRQPKGGGQDQLAVGALETFLQLTPVGFQAHFLFNTVVVPLIFGPRPVTIKGKVAYVPLKDLIDQEQAAVNTIGALGGAAETVGVANPLFGLSTIADFALTSAELALSKPLSGAFISVTQSGGPLNVVPGRLNPGMVYATSGADGTFLTVAPKAGDQYLVTATHPLYQKALTIPVNPVSFNPLNPTQLSLAGVVFKNFYFSQPLALLTPPNVNIATVPAEPSAGVPCTVQVTAYQPTAPPNVGVIVFDRGHKDLLTGQPVANPQADFTEHHTTTNGNTVVWTGTLVSASAIEVTLRVVVQGQNPAQDPDPIPYAIDFTGPQPPTIVPNIPPPDTNDVHGPLVVETDPVDNGYIGEDGTISVFFNKPIDPLAVNNLAGIILTGAGTPLAPIVRLSADRQVLILQYPGLQPGETYRLTLSDESVRDLAGKALDQRPSTPEPDSFTTTFRTPPPATAALEGLVNGRGAAIGGSVLYVLDGSAQGNYLLAYDISTPLQPNLLSRTALAGTPRDLVVIPQFRYLLNADDHEIKTNDLVAVVGGDLDTQINQAQGETVSVRGQYLALYNMGDPKAPQRLASPTISFRAASAVTKVRWAPPFLVYQEFGADIQLLGFVNLQEMIIGFNSTLAERAAFPDPAHRTDQNRGIDKNGDGDYVDPGETLPMPDADPAEFYGKHQNYVLQHTTQKILDFSVAAGGNFVGITLRNGVQLDDNNQPTGTNLPPMYRTLVFNGQPLNLALPQDASLPFGATAYPRWVTLFDSLRVTINGVPSDRSIALVSLEPDIDGTQKLAVIDISLPETPKLLNEVPIPTSILGGDMQSISLRNDGLLELAGSQNLVLLDPVSLTLTTVPDGQLHPAIVGVIPSAGGITRSLGTTDYGVHAVADSGRGLVVQSPPQFRFVSFPQNPSLLDPQILSPQSDAALAQLFASMHKADGLAPARLHAMPTLNLLSDLTPQPNVALHYYVLVTAPGGAGPIINLGLEALNLAGRPLSNLGHGFAPVRAVSDSTQAALNQTPRPNCGAPIRTLPAYRVSNNPSSLFYNYYLSRPFALIAEAASSTELAQLTTQPDREILFSDAALRAFLDPEQPTQGAKSVFGPFLTQIDTDRLLLYPLAQVTAPTVSRDYLTGDNPPPPGGAVDMPGSYGSVCAHSGELRIETTDLVLPSPHMPIEIKRAIGNQDTYEGPFGVGWDFDYNQRVTELDPQSFPLGLQMPVIARDNADDSEIAGSQDVLFHTGMGQTVVFKWMNRVMPAEYAQDPLVAAFDYVDLVSDYFLPEPGQGIFDLLVKFKDGRFERLTPGGVRYRYAPNGRLEMIIDRFPGNHHDLQYDSNGWLVRIDDRSVSAPRYVEFGYFRRKSTDANFTDGLDMDTQDSYLEGKICRLRDFTGRDVLYEYSADGFLTNRLGIQVAGENGGYTGRSHTFYLYNGCQLVGVAATADGAPVLSVDNATGNGGKPVAQSSTGIGGRTQYTVPVNNSAASLDQQITKAGLADGSATQFQVDKWGHPISMTVSGAGGPSATTITSNNADGLLLFVKHPEGNSETTTYDSANPVFRSRGNLLSVTADPGPRGRVGYTKTFSYDPSYNQKSGPQKTPDGFTWTYTLSPDKRTVTSITYGAAGAVTFDYDSRGQLLSHTDIRGVQTQLKYDSNTGFVLSRKLGDNTYTFSYGSDLAGQLGEPDSITLPEGAPLVLKYNAELQKVEVGRGALIEDFGYDEEGHPVFHQLQLGNGKALISHSAFDAKGFLLTNLVDGVDVDGTPTTLEYDFTPDAVSRLKSIRYPQGTVQTFDYDNRGNVTNTTLGDYVEQYAVDLNDDVTAVKQGGDVVKTTTYDGLNRPITVTRKTGSQDETEAYTYYPGGEVQSRTASDAPFGVVQQETDDQIDELGRKLHRTITGTTISPTYHYTYAAGSQIEQGPRMSVTNTWDSAGYGTGYGDAILNEVLHPDSAGRLTQVDRQEQGAIYHDFFAYDDLDHRVSAGDDLGIHFLYLARADGNLLSMTNAHGHATTYDHSVLGELSSKHRADGMEFRYQYDRERQKSYTGDPTAGYHFTYDNDLRLANSTLRNGATVGYGNFDGRNMPQTVTIPGGTITRSFDLQGREIDKTASYQTTSYATHKTYDALDRVRILTYQQDGGALNTATYTYDQAGPLLSARFRESPGDFTVQYAYYDDGTRKAITYPSGVTVSEQRDTSGRLTGVSDAGGNIISALAWQGNRQPKQVNLGDTMQVINSYDARGRLTGSRVTRLRDGAVLAHLRYQYDAADNLQIRQFLHRNGKADSFSYDAGERLSEAQIAGLPLAPSGTTPPLYDRTYNYHLGGLDYLTSTITTNLTPDLPAFATNWTSHDDFLLPSVVDGFNRGPADPMGNVAQALLQVRPDGAEGSVPVAAALTNNGNGSLTWIARADGVVEENFFQPGGLRYERRISQNGQVLDDRHFVYDNAGRLLEEYQQTNGTPTLIGRYYYATGDAPDAADLADPATGNFQRYYFLKDNMQSVVAVADTNGVVVERAWYDPFGQPAIEQRDTQPPKLQRVIGGDGNALLLAFSEPISPPANDPGPGGGIVRFPTQPTDGIITVSVLSSNISGTVELPPLVAGYPPYSVLKFTPSQPLPTTAPVGFVGWWPADGNANDVRRAHDGSLKGGATFGPGLIGQAFVLNGTSAFVEIPDDPALNLGSKDFTAALWVNFNNTAGEQVLIEKWIDATKSGWSLIKLTNNVLRLALSDGAGGEVDVDSAVLAIPKTNWVHYAVRRQGTQFTIFTNAVPVASGSAAASVSAATSLKFGSREGTSFFLNGSIDEVTLYSRALSDAEIAAVAGGVQQPGPVTLTVNPGTLVDEWGNTNGTETVSFQVFSQTGLVYYAAEPVPQTAAAPLARSSIGSPFLFHGQYFDYDTGLIYLRARFYDPYSGMMLEPDPLGYEDSVNLYAGMGNNPVGVRDPTGLGGIIEFFKRLFQGFRRVERADEALQKADRELSAAEQTTRELQAGIARVNEPMDEVISGATARRASMERLKRAEDLRRFDDRMRAQQGEAVMSHLEYEDRFKAPENMRRTFSGHGYVVMQRTFRVPEGTTFVIWGKAGNPINDDIAHMIEAGRSEQDILSFAAQRKAGAQQALLNETARGITPQRAKELQDAIMGYDLLPPKVYRPGDVVFEHVLLPPDANPAVVLNVMPGNRITVNAPSYLSDLLKPGMGQVHWSACRELWRW